MYFPVKIYTTSESLLIFQLSIPLWFSFQWGVKMNNVKHRDRLFDPQLEIGSATDVKCLHFFIIGFRIRIRSFNKMKELHQHFDDVQRLLFTRYIGWQQVAE